MAVDVFGTMSRRDEKARDELSKGPAARARHHVSERSRRGGVGPCVYSVALAVEKNVRFVEAFVGWEVERQRFFLKCYRRQGSSTHSTLGAVVWHTGLMSLADLESSCAQVQLVLPDVVRQFLRAAQRGDAAKTQTLEAFLGSSLRTR